MSIPKACSDFFEKSAESALAALDKDFSGLRTGRASTGLLEPITVEAYGGRMPMTQVGNISVVDARMLSVQVWDQQLVSAVEKALRGCGFNPIVEGATLRVPLPEPSQEKRKEMAKMAKKIAEDAKVGVRNIRRDALDQLNKQKDGISEDIMHNTKETIQKLTDKTIAVIEERFLKKEKEILTV